MLILAILRFSSAFWLENWSICVKWQYFIRWENRLVTEWWNIGKIRYFQSSLHWTYSVTVSIFNLRKETGTGNRHLKYHIVHNEPSFMLSHLIDFSRNYSPFEIFQCMRIKSFLCILMNFIIIHLFLCILVVILMFSHIKPIEYFRVNCPFIFEGCSLRPSLRNCLRLSIGLFGKF